MGLFNAIKSAVLGDAISSDFTKLAVVTSFGDGDFWEVAHGKVTKTGENVSLFTLSKTNLNTLHSHERDCYLLYVKNGLDVLSSLKYPGFLRIVKTLTETKTAYVFVTEPVAYNLNSLMSSQNLKSKMSEVKLKYGIMQFLSCLSYLHEKADLVAGYLSPSYIVLDENMRWKIGGFLFSQKLSNTSDNESLNFSIVSRIYYGYLAPETLLNPRDIGVSSDVFTWSSILLSLFNAYYGNSYSTNPLVCRDSSTFESALRDLQNYNNHSYNSVPEVFRHSIHSCLLSNKGSRGSLAPVLRSGYFQDCNLTALKSIDLFSSMTKQEKLNLLASIVSVVPSLSDDVVSESLVPLAVRMIADVEMTLSCLKIIVTAASKNLNLVNSSSLTSTSFIFESRDYEIINYILTNVDIIMNLYKEKSLERQLMPLLVKALESNKPDMQEVVLNKFVVTVTSKFGSEEILHKILPNIVNLIVNPSTSNKIQVVGLIKISELLPQLDVVAINRYIVPMLTSITNGNIGFLMAYIGVIIKLLEKMNENLDRNVIVNSFIPLLLRISFTSNFNKKQFETYRKVISKLFSHACEQQLEYIRNTYTEPTCSNNLEPTKASVSKIVPSSEGFFSSEKPSDKFYTNNYGNEFNAFVTATENSNINSQNTPQKSSTNMTYLQTPQNHTAETKLSAQAEYSSVGFNSNIVPNTGVSNINEIQPSTNFVQNFSQPSQSFSSTTQPFSNHALNQSVTLNAQTIHQNPGNSGFSSQFQNGQQFSQNCAPINSYTESFASADMLSYVHQASPNTFSMNNKQFGANIFSSSNPPGFTSSMFTNTAVQHSSANMPKNSITTSNTKAEFTPDWSAFDQIIEENKKNSR